MLSGKIVSRVLFISCIHSQCIQIPWIAKDGGIVSHFHVASAQIQCIFNWILCVCYKQTPAPHLIKVSEVMTQKKERKKEILLFWVLKLRKKVFDQIRIDSFVLSDDAKLSFRKSGGKVLKVDVRCALQRSTSGSDQTEKSRSQVKLWGERWHEHNVGTYVLPDGKSRGHGWTCLGWSKYTIIGILSLLWKKKHLRIDSRRENQCYKNDFPSSRFARWPGQRQALFVQTGKIWRE